MNKQLTHIKIILKKTEFKCLFKEKFINDEEKTLVLKKFQVSLTLEKINAVDCLVDANKNFLMRTIILQSMICLKYIIPKLFCEISYLYCPQSINIISFFSRFRILSEWKMLLSIIDFSS